jgi:hypothetical protein
VRAFIPLASGLHWRALVRLPRPASLSSRDSGALRAEPFRVLAKLYVRTPSASRRRLSTGRSEPRGLSAAVAPESLLGGEDVMSAAQDSPFVRIGRRCRAEN